MPFIGELSRTKATSIKERNHPRVAFTPKDCRQIAEGVKRRFKQTSFGIVFRHLFRRGAWGRAFHCNLAFAGLCGKPRTMLVRYVMGHTARTPWIYSLPCFPFPFPRTCWLAKIWKALFVLEIDALAGNQLN